MYLRTIGRRFTQTIAYFLVMNSKRCNIILFFDRSLRRTPRCVSAIYFYQRRKKAGGKTRWKLHKAENLLPNATKHKRRNEETGALKASNPKEVFHRLIEEKGGVGKLTSPGEHPRSYQQVADFRRSASTSASTSNSSNKAPDSLVELMQMCRKENRNPDSAFVRQVHSSPELQAILCTHRSHGGARQGGEGVP